MHIKMENRRIGPVFSFSYRDVNTADFVEIGNSDLHELEGLIEAFSGNESEFDDNGLQLTELEGLGSQ